MRYLNIADKQGRDAIIQFGSELDKVELVYKTPKRDSVDSIRILKQSSQTNLDALTKKAGNLDKVSDLLVQSDPELDPFLTGKVLKSTQELFISKEGKPCFVVKAKQKIFTPSHEVKEERDYQPTPANVNETMPIFISDKEIPISEAIRKFAFVRTYQLFHTNGLTFDFLYGIAEHLAKEEALAFVGAGKKLEPMVFQDGGKPYRGFLEGRIEKKSYMLLLHLSNLELKKV